MFSLLRQPYPVSEKSPFRIFVTGLLAGAFVALFLIIFQPFGTATVAFPGKNLFLAGYGLIVAVLIWLATALPSRLFNGEHWTVGKQILLMACVTMLGITFSYFYVLRLGGSPSLVSYGIFVGNALLVAIFPIVGIILSDYLIKLKRYANGARAINENFIPPVPSRPAGPNPELTFKDEQGLPLTTLIISHIWCLRSDRNYVDIFHENQEGSPTRTTVRNTLTSLSEELPEDFLRCHRSYVVNRERVASVSGNAQGYRLHDPVFPDLPVPVSRSKSTAILDSIQH